MSRAVNEYFASMHICSEAEKFCIQEACIDFSDQIAIDVKNFILQLTLESIDESPRKVIVFPEVNDLGHLLIDEIIKIFPNLVSFIVGPQKSKRIVVCSHAIVKNKVLGDLAAGDFPKEKCNVQKEEQIAELSTKQQPISSTDLVITNEELLLPSTPSSSSLSSLSHENNSNSIVQGNCEIKETSNKLPSSPKSKSSSSSSSLSKTTTRLGNNSNNRIARPSCGIFKRALTELAADRNKNDNSSSNDNRQVSNPLKSNHVPQPQQQQVSTVAGEKTCLSNSTSTDSNNEDEDITPCMPQPEEDDYWKPLSNIHLNEILCILGSVEIVKPKWKQISCDMQISLKEQALNHILEIYNMNENIVTRDLNLMFVKFKTSGFNIKWVDSERALIIFACAAKASEALSIQHPVIKTRPVVIASRESKLRILQCSQYLLPYKDRPKTVATVARRMISNSLGREFETSIEVEEKERNIIQQARAEKLLKEKTLLSEKLKLSPATEVSTQSSNPIQGNAFCDDEADLESFNFH